MFVFKVILCYLLPKTPCSPEADYFSVIYRNITVLNGSTARDCLLFRKKGQEQLLLCKERMSIHWALGAHLQ